MAHGDDLASVSLQMSMTVAQTAGSVVREIIADLLKMLQAQREYNLRRSELQLRSGIDTSPLKGGEVRVRDLMDSARKTADSVSMSEHSISEADKNKLTGLADQYGIPIAFTKRGEDSYMAHVRGRDVPVLKEMLTDLMQDKINQKQSIGNFKLQKWEIPFLTNELNHYQLNAQFGQTKKGDYFCMYDKQDEKAVLIARSEFHRKYKEVRDNFTASKDEQGFFVLKDKASGKEITFDDTQKSCREISAALQENFGYDKNKADIAAAKFGEENLQGKFKRNYFDNPINDTKSITTNIAFADENAYTEQYTCMRVVPKTDSTQRVIFADNDGRFAVLDPKMTHSEMADELKAQFGLSDKKEIDALVSKAEKTMLYYAKNEEQKFTSEIKFDKKDFNMSDIETVSGMRREMDGHVYTRSLPVDELKLDIDRTGKNSFSVKSHAVHVETNENQETTRSTESRMFTFSFSDKKQAVHELEAGLMSQGVPQPIANRAAMDAYGKAEAQETSRIVSVEGVKTDSAAHYSADLTVEAEVYSAGKSAAIDVSDKKNGLEQLQSSFGVDKDTAMDMYDDIERKLTDKQQNVLEGFGYECEDWTITEASYVIGKISENDWKVPDDMQPSEFSIDSLRNPTIELKTDKHELPVPEVPDMDDVSLGGR
ncbi:MAG: hypothetical protein IKH71_03020 [Oscillospiraceae bacterium]|nr:hypothetical protein [Oscillospiraceae bacterium]